MSKLKPSQALGMWALTAFVLYFIASIVSFAFSMDEWNWFSKIIFWIPTFILGVWTINDYFISTNK